VLLHDAVPARVVAHQGRIVTVAHDMVEETLRTYRIEEAEDGVDQ
jgi:hypothetical protein